MNSAGAIRDARLGNVEPAVAHRHSGGGIVGSGRGNAFGGLTYRLIKDPAWCDPFASVPGDTEVVGGSLRHTVFEVFRIVMEASGTDGGGGGGTPSNLLWQSGPPANGRMRYDLDASGPKSHPADASPDHRRPMST